MGRQGPMLVPFLQSGLVLKKYRNLISEDSLGLKFSVVLPHKTKKLEVEDELILKDWYTLNKKKYVFGSKHYTDAKQAMFASLRKSDYVEKVHVSDDKITYRILSDVEVKEKKKLKKDTKKRNEKEVQDSDDAVSSEESGYGSAANSPKNDYALASMNEELNTLSCRESPQASYPMKADSLSELNGVPLNTFSGFLKSEPMESNIFLNENILASSEYIAVNQSFTVDLKLADFPENVEHLMEIDSSELNISSVLGELQHIDTKYDLQLDSLPDKAPHDLVKEIPANIFNQPLENEEDNHALEMQNFDKLPTELEDMLMDELFEKLMESVEADGTVDLPSLITSGENNQVHTSSFPDADMLNSKTETKGTIYHCKNCVYLGKTPILLCEPQFVNVSDETLDIKIAFDERVRKEINGFKSVKEYKFINDHLMVILEPNDD